jgi:hypothetical protein
MGIGCFQKMRQAGLGNQECARALTCCIRSKRFISVSAMPVSEMALALLTQISITAKLFHRGVDRALHLILEAYVATNRERLAARLFNVLGGAEDGAGSLGLGSFVLAAMAILAPSREARSAMASPIPRLAPVMNSVFPWSDMEASERR